MSDNTPDSPIRQTKLYRPPVTVDYVPRDALEARLEQGLDLPLTVVTAPAGYGKSTLISHWLESSDQPGVWLSLDESDNELSTFLNYFVAAIRTVSSRACQKTLAMINADSLPPVAALAAYLSNDLEALNKRIIFILDDYHHIRDPEIHTLLDTLLQHPPRKLHLAILTRRDPLLSLASFRARHLLTEIRMRDLEFSDSETQALLERVIEQPLAAKALNALQTNTEGWPVGVRLAALALHHQEDVEGFLERFGADNRPLNDYLFSEVLSLLSPDMRKQLVYAAILDQFNAPLCEALWAGDLSGTTEQPGGAEFIENLRASDVLCIALDDRQEWYRFHHLLKETLVQELNTLIGPAKIAELHKRASTWLAQHGFSEEAARHALYGGDEDAAADIIGRERHALMNSDQWRRLERWLNLFPEAVVESKPQLLMLRCWLQYHHWYRIDLFIQDLDRVKSLVKKIPPGTPELKKIKAEIASLSTIAAYSVPQPKQCIALAEDATGGLLIEMECVRATAVEVQIHATQMLGDLKQSSKLLWDALDSDAFPSPNSNARFLMAACFAAWTEADTFNLRQAAEKLLRISEQYELSWSLSFAHYFIGLADYDNNDLSAAITHFEAVTQEPYLFQFYNVVSCSFLLSQSFQALNRQHESTEVAEKVSHLAFDRGNRALMGAASAYQAELDLRQGDLRRAAHWLSSYESPPTHIMHRYYQPEFTAVKILLAQDTAESRKAAQKMLNSLQTSLKAVCNRRLLTDTLALQALICWREDDQQDAIARLSEAITIAYPGHLIRPFADLGPELIPILNRLDTGEGSLEYIGEIIASMQGVGGESPSTAQQTGEPLSQRELDILRLLSQDISNKEVAEKLFISPGTVKRHAHNIYGKLAVKNRREAVAKAVGLGFLNAP